jgi:hypothetical protein
MAIKLSTSKDCRSAYREILQGYTYCEERDFYIKHFKESDLGFIDDVYKKCSKMLEKKGVSSQREKLNFLKDEEYWSQEEEESYITATLAVKDAYGFAEKMPDGDQRKQFEETLLIEAEENFKRIQKERSELVEPTIETICDKRLNEFYVFSALYKDKEFEEHFFTKEEFEDLSYFELGELVKTYNHETSKFAEKNLKRIGVNFFFLNSFFMSEDDPVKFYGKNVLNLTMYQLNLFSRGKFYKSILIEGNDPPDQYYEESYENGLDELIKWYDSQNAQMQLKRTQQNMRSR